MSDNQIPHGPKNFYCPLWKKEMVKVCHTCPLWVKVRGKNPHSMQEIDKWDCSLAWLPMLLIENTQISRHTTAAVESFRNEAVRRSGIPAKEEIPQEIDHYTQRPLVDLQQSK